MITKDADFYKKEFGNFTMLTVPAYLKKYGSRLLHHLLLDENNGNHLDPNLNKINLCTPCGMHENRKHFNRTTHECDAVPIINLPCQVRFHIFKPANLNGGNWEIVF